MENSTLLSNFQSLAEVQSKNEEELLKHKNVVGLGLGHKIKANTNTGDICLTVFVTQKVSKKSLKDNEIIPETISNLKTDVIEIGPVYAQTNPVLNNRLRPFHGGFSIAHFKVTAGTSAALVVDKNASSPTKYYVLSNCHVLANSGAATIGDAIYQPGPFDGGVASDTIGKLTKFIPISFAITANNTVDCAIAEIDSLEYFNGEIHAIGYPNGIATVTVGSKIQKSGRTTGYTKGSVTAINATINVGYGSFGTARFINQIVATPMSAGGDSGSLVLNMDNKAVGLLFAGSTGAMIMNPISKVLDSLSIEFIK
ncbi:MAG: S1 family peptidase [Anaerolineae bacterium]|nr:S1 family peptidase [Anaerolineae bacterium]